MQIRPANHCRYVAESREISTSVGQSNKEAQSGSAAAYHLDILDCDVL